MNNFVLYRHIRPDKGEPFLSDKGCNYLYRHIRLDTNEVFYVGIGYKRKKKFRTYKNEYERAFSKTNRSRYWKNIINSTEYEIEILMESDNREFIKEKEIEFIKLYGRKDKKEGTLVNVSDGGESSCGKIISEEHKNINRKICTERSIGNNFGAKVIEQYNKEMIKIREYSSIKQAALITGISYDTIRKFPYNKSNGGGFIWKHK